MLSGLGKWRGSFAWECRDANGQLRWSRGINNGTTTVGVNDFLNVVFRGTTQSANWYIGIIAQSAFTGVSASDTHSSHAGWTEWTLYSGNRPSWTPAAASGGSMITSINASMFMTSAGQLRGVFLANSANKDSASGPILYCTAVATAALTVAASDTITVYFVGTIS